jgi:hypothetical protein
MNPPATGGLGDVTATSSVSGPISRATHVGSGSPRASSRPPPTWPTIVGRGVVGNPHVPEPLVLSPRATGPAWSDDPIPHALVTSRMLWAAFGQGRLCRVRQR